MTLPNPVPLGVSGSITVPLEAYLASIGEQASPEILLDDRQRIGYLTQRLDEALARPLTSPGSEGVAREVLSHFEGVEVLPALAEKALETLRDDQVHDRLAIATTDQRLAIWFVAWPGSHREVQSQRYGKYLKSFAGTGYMLVQRGIEIGGILEIDAYLRDNAEARTPGRSLGEVFRIDVEYSYLPGFMLGSPNHIPGLLSKVILLNPDLCSPEDLEVVEKLKRAP